MAIHTLLTAFLTLMFASKFNATSELAYSQVNDELRRQDTDGNLQSFQRSRGPIDHQK